MEFIKDFISFVKKEIRVALFAGSFLLLLFVSAYIHIPGLYRYDFLFIAAILIQILMIVFKLETKDEAKTIFLFHIIGLVLEIYKTNPHIGSWSYPEMGYLKVFNVPLYSGFMYASIGSYIAGAWKGLKLKLVHYPKQIYSVILCVLIYLNFFTNHFIYDYRIFLLIAIFILYFKVKIEFTPRIRTYSMPLVLGFTLTAFFVWVAENVGTFYGAWLYPYQVHVWHVVSFQKITSWFLMVIICFIIVTYLKHIKEQRLIPEN
ncbi:MAG: DUF817 domain-containing protein [Patescibacteria group bacterium]